MPDINKQQSVASQPSVGAVGAGLYSEATQPKKKYSALTVASLGVVAGIALPLIGFALSYIFVSFIGYDATQQTITHIIVMLFSLIAVICGLCAIVISYLIVKRGGKSSARAGVIIMNVVSFILVIMNTEGVITNIRNM
ncbi:hypothetical protein A3F37_03145 [Candidatus Saccharibacteria bacterium RIFCSPHIGHO2_12_FULL_41_12]|nr:MAG: hypothetical protein A3F37_03145 [Candidatus Saccharibacteria bacterium RIFCSPHIGHO2_12_FULL_41_12]